MKGTSPTLGWVFVAAGAALFIVGASPIFPAIHWEGILIGLVSIGVGVWILAGPEVRAEVRRAIRMLSESRLLGRRAKRRRREIPAIRDPLLPVRVLKLARERAGVLTVGEVAVELGVPIAQAEASLEECVRTGNALPDYDVTRGYAIYKFPEFLPPQETPH